MNVIVLMAGPSKDFENRGHVYLKYLLEINGEAIIQRVVKSLMPLQADISFIIRKEDDDKIFFGSTLKILAPTSTIYKVGNITQGAACTALFAIDSIDNDDELVIINGDQLLTSGISEAVTEFRQKNYDGGVICFRSIHPRWSFVALDENGLVNQTSEKLPISDLATAGFYYFKHGKDFVEAAFDNIRKDVNYDGKYYVCSTFNELILSQKNVGVYEIAKTDYISFSTPQMYDNYINQRKIK